MVVEFCISSKKIKGNRICVLRTIILIIHQYFCPQTEESSEVDNSDQRNVSNNKGRGGTEQASGGVKRKLEDDDDDDDFSHDEVRLWEDGFKDRYYESKFAVSPTDHKFRSKVAAEYVRGLCWVLQYYYQVFVQLLNFC